MTWTLKIMSITYDQVKPKSALTTLFINNAAQVAYTFNSQ
jgi:hypothetical protein